MSRIKRVLDEIIEDMYRTPLFELDRMLNINQQLEEESFEVNKGNYKTNIKCKFTPKGEPVGITYESVYVPSELEDQQNQLQLKLDEAVEKEDFLLAADLKKQLQELGQKQLKKPQKAVTN